jgi:hypothetical protein
MFGYFLVRKSEFPHIEKARQLARKLTEDQIDEILAGKRHTHRNPPKKADRKPAPITTSDGMSEEQASPDSGEQI